MRKKRISLSLSLSFSTILPSLVHFHKWEKVGGEPSRRWHKQFDSSTSNMPRHLYFFQRSFLLIRLTLPRTIWRLVRLDCCRPQLDVWFGRTGLCRSRWVVVLDDGHGRCIRTLAAHRQATRWTLAHFATKKHLQQSGGYCNVERCSSLVSKSDVNWCVCLFVCEHKI